MWHNKNKLSVTNSYILFSYAWEWHGSGSPDKWAFTENKLCGKHKVMMWVFIQQKNLHKPTPLLRCNLQK